MSKTPTTSNKMFKMLAILSSESVALSITEDIELLYIGVFEKLLAFAEFEFVLVFVFVFALLDEFCVKSISIPGELEFVLLEN